MQAEKSGHKQTRTSAPPARGTNPKKPGLKGVSPPPILSPHLKSISDIMEVGSIKGVKQLNQPWAETTARILTPTNRFSEGKIEVKAEAKLLKEYKNLIAVSGNLSKQKQPLNPPVSSKCIEPSKPIS